MVVSRLYRYFAALLGSQSAGMFCLLVMFWFLKRLPSLIIGCLGLGLAFYALEVAYAEYKIANRPEPVVQQIKDKSERMFVKTWNTLERVILGKTSASDVCMQEITLTYCKARSLWRKFNQAIIALFVALTMAFMAFCYLRKLLS